MATRAAPAIRLAWAFGGARGQTEAITSFWLSIGSFPVRALPAKPLEGAKFFDQWHARRRYRTDDDRKYRGAM